MSEKEIISKSDVEHVAKLARIRLNEDDINLFTEQFAEILEYFTKLDEVKTDDVPPTFHVIDVKNVFRNDKISKSLEPGAAMKNAPEIEKTYFKAPKIIE